MTNSLYVKVVDDAKRLADKVDGGKLKVSKALEVRR